MLDLSTLHSSKLHEAIKRSLSHYEMRLRHWVSEYKSPLRISKEQHCVDIIPGRLLLSIG